MLSMLMLSMLISRHPNRGCLSADPNCHILERYFLFPLSPAFIAHEPIPNNAIYIYLEYDQTHNRER